MPARFYANPFAMTRAGGVLRQTPLMTVIDRAWADTAARMAYRLILRRPIDPGALAEWRRRLSANPSDLVALVNALVLSEEYRMLTRSVSDSVVLNYLHHERCRLVRNLPAAGVIVDLGGVEPADPRGCLLTMGYPHRFNSLTIVDLPPHQSLEQQRAAGRFDAVQTPLGPVGYVYGPMQELSRAQLESGSVDLVWMGQSIEHISEADLDSLLPEIHRVLRPGGWFCFDTPNRRVTRAQAPHGYIHPDHKIEYEVPALRDKLTRAGFHIVRVAGLGLARGAADGAGFSSAELMDNMPLNDDPERSYVIYFELQR
jgi:SAM-dependent methyltransferase